MNKRSKGAPRTVTCASCGKSREIRGYYNPTHCAKCSGAIGGRVLGKVRPGTAFKNCKCCGGEFRSRRSYNKAYCCSGCRKRDYASRKLLRNCKYCGKSFVVRKSAIGKTTNASGNYCRRKCYSESLVKPDKETPTIFNRAPWKNIRSEMLEKTPFCWNCGAKERLHIHHLVPRRLGGDESPGNLSVVCGSCHNIVEELVVAAEGVGVNIPKWSHGFRCWRD